MSANRTGRQWKVGDLSRETGLTVRTLHHYDELGLVTPSTRTESGHRLYGEADVARLQQVLSLRSLGFALEEIRDCLRQREFSQLRVVQLHLDRLTEQIALQHQLRERLECIARLLDSGRIVSAEEFLRSIAAMSKIESYYTPEQLEYLRQRREIVGEERMQAAAGDWEAIRREMRAEMERGTDPADPRVQAIARRMQGLIDEFTGGDPGIEASLNRMYQDNAAPPQAGTPDPALFEYVARARAVLREQTE